MTIPNASEMHIKADEFLNNFEMIKVVSYIESSAESGLKTCEMTNLSDSTISELQKHGYTITKRDPTKECCAIYKIKW